MGDDDPRELCAHLRISSGQIQLMQARQLQWSTNDFYKTFDCGYDYVYDDENGRIILFIIYDVHLTAQGKSSLGLKHVVFVIFLVFNSSYFVSELL